VTPTIDAARSRLAQGLPGKGMNLDSFSAPRAVPYDPTDPLRARLWRCADCGHLEHSTQPAPSPQMCPACKSVFLEKGQAPLQ